MTQRYGVTYSGMDSDYIVVDLADPHFKPLFKSSNKSECIAKAQELNGWPINGDEQLYAKQRELTGSRK